ncbi:hypothetical protein JNJ66_06255 [Candidatus Saccharibacteria bacterium]|nr:hypothetical protein [Candidatus Saccharibacteria bacterium]
MWAKKSGGFTIIEVMLFLAVSGLLLTVALIGTGSMMRQIRFSDSGRSLHAFVQGQYNDILTGVNPRTANAACAASATSGAGSSRCLLLGKLIRFETDSDVVKSYPVIATRIPDLAGADATLSDEQLIATAAQPVVIKNTGVEEFEIPWGAEIIGSRRTSDKQTANTYLLLRSPRSSRIVSYTFNATPTEFNTMSSLTSRLTPAATQRATNYCFQGIETPGLPAMLIVAGGQGQNDIRLQFDVTPAGNCDNV